LVDPPSIVFCPVDPHPLPIVYERKGDHFEYRGNYQGRQKRVGSDVDVCFSGRVAVSLISLDAG
jgi:5'-nucleotidase